MAEIRGEIGDEKGIVISAAPLWSGSKSTDVENHATNDRTRKYLGSTNRIDLTDAEAIEIDKTRVETEIAINHVRRT